MATQGRTAAARVVEHVDELTESMLDALSDLIRIPSIGGTTAENDAQHWMAEQYAAADLEVDLWPLDLPGLQAHPDFPGVEVARDRAWGLVGRLPGAGAGSLMLNGHIDVVPTGDPHAWEVAPFAATVRNAHLHGRGSCDMKAGAIANLWAVLALRAAGIAPAGDVLLASVQGEEDGGLGTFALLERGWRADRCVITEPTQLDVIPANSGALTFRLRVHGAATHAARRTSGVSAIEKFVVVWEALRELEAKRHRAVDPLAARWDLAHPLSVGTIRAGDWASSVPDLLVAEGRLGVALGESVAHARSDLESAIRDACEADPWLRAHPVEVEWWGGQFAAGAIPVDSDLIGLVQAAHRLATGDRAQDVYAAPYGSDLRLLTNLGGIPTVQYGPGDAALAHGPHESVPLDEVHLAARTLAVLMTTGAPPR